MIATVDSTTSSIQTVLWAADADGRTPAERAPGGARARPGEQEGNVHVDCGLRGQEWSGVGRRGGGETDSRRRRRRRRRPQVD